MLRDKHPAGMRSAALVVAGNAILAERAEAAGAVQVAVVPTVIDLDRYPPPSERPPNAGVPRVCWVGQRSTADFLKPHRELFATMGQAGQASFLAIGIDAGLLGLPMESQSWTEAGEVAAISACDIGIMPLTDGPFERGKCGYKLIQYMACGLPVVASPVGANCEIVEHGVNGFLADTPEQWREALSALASDPQLRARMGAAGRKRVEERYSLQVTGPELARLLSSVIRCGLERRLPERV
jgi:glycosyltransferase involved in cell wall biosynthesis